MTAESHGGHLEIDLAASESSPPPQPSPFEGEGAVDPSQAVAIVGMAGRFGGAESVEAFWDGLCRGADWVRTLSRDELLAAGEDARALADPAYVPRRGVLPDIELFAAPFFDVTPRDAEITDPQQRLLLECAWEALEDAGLDTERCDGLVGVYASASVSTYHQRVLQHRGLANVVGSIPSELGNDTDYLATRISYKLDLRGPSMSVQTACSSSLVAVHVAVQSLLRGECDVALAGGASVQVPQAGYHYREGGIASPDGRCRTFDAGANGAVGGSGVGMVVLRRLADAEAEGHHVHAVIRGSAVNNDGSGKVGFTAPGLQGQAEVIAEAHAVAGVSPRSITYVEAHGTGTALGDPVEVRALTQAFRAGTPDAGFCAIGSVKTNLGHLDAAAGVAGLVKAALAVRHGRIPPSLHFSRPNPACELEGSPFVVASELRHWEAEPRRAGVSSFGLGGTNAHVVLEQPPAPPATSAARPGHLLLLSARTPTALARATANLAGHLERHPEQDLADVAHTLRVGRRQLEHRLALVCAGREEAVRALRGQGEAAAAIGERPRREPPVVFMLPGQGAQHAGMGRDLYRHEPAFRACVDRCAELLAPELGGLDLRDALYGEEPAPAGPSPDPSREGSGEGRTDLDETWLAQPALFVTSYALARTLIDWGVRPDAMIGHSLGEYVAACLAGVLDLEDALRLVALRGRLMQAAPRGAMASVALGEDELRGILPAALAVAAVNGPRQCVVSGPAEAIGAFEARLADAGVRTRRLRTSHAFHSALQEPAVPPLVEALGGVRLGAPRVRYVSNLTGDWVTPAQAADPAAWGRQLRETVRFGDGVRTLAADPEAVLVEVGPGAGLSGLARQQVEPGRVVAAMRHAGDPRSDRAALLDALGRLWVAGVAVDWAAFGRPERRRLLPLPRYPFERQRYWIGAAPASGNGNGHANGEAPARALVAYPRAAGLPAYVAPRTAAEERVAEVWRELIGTDRIGATDDFFLLGGTSLTATQLVARLGERFGLDLPLRLVFEHPTVGGLALAVEDRLLAEIEALSDDEVAALEEVADGV